MFNCYSKQTSSKWVDSTSEGHLQGFSSILQGFSSKIVNRMRGQRSNRSLILVRYIEVGLCLLYFWHVFSFYLTFDPSFSSQILKRNLVSVPRKRNLFILKRLVLEWITYITPLPGKNICRSEKKMGFRKLLPLKCWYLEGNSFLSNKEIHKMRPTF